MWSEYYYKKKKNKTLSEEQCLVQVQTIIWEWRKKYIENHVGEAENPFSEEEKEKPIKHWLGCFRLGP